MFDRSVKFTFTIYLFVLALFSVYSYSLTDPNLVLSSWPPYWQFQNWMWQTFFLNTQALASTYMVLIGTLFSVYFILLLQVSRSNQAKFPVTKMQIWRFLLVVVVLGLSYNALSHDVFNYIFNAKLVAVYHQNPHIITALSYPEDDWTRFMHNTHTTAPYGYGWTVISILPFWLGFGKFVLTWLAFRAMALVSLGLLFVGLNKLHRQLYGQAMSLLDTAIFFLNPLVLLEVVSNMHNDLWMIAPAVFALVLVLQLKNQPAKQWIRYLFVGLLLSVSISVKYATLVLAPIFFWLIAERLVVDSVLKKSLKVPWQSKLVELAIKFIESLWQKYLPLMCSLLLFLPLLTGRSQLFHPWYLLWSLAFLPLIKQSWWRLILLSFSVSSLVRYYPWLQAGSFEGSVVIWQQLITWTVPVLLLILIYKAKWLQPLKQVLTNTV